jgi:hypothetical protein
MGGRSDGEGGGGGKGGGRWGIKMEVDRGRCVWGGGEVLSEGTPSSSKKIFPGKNSVLSSSRTLTFQTFHKERK